MADKILAANEIKKFLAAFKGLSLVAEELEKLGSLEQAAKEAKKNFDSVMAEKESLFKELAEVKKQIEEHKALLPKLEAEKKDIKQQFSLDVSLMIAKLDAEKKEVQDKHDRYLEVCLQEKNKAFDELKSLSVQIEEKKKLYQEAIEKIEALKRGL